MFWSSHSSVSNRRIRKHNLSRHFFSLENNTNFVEIGDAPLDRWTRIKEIPIYIDRRQGEAKFINERLAEDNGHFAILEANGGSTVWSRKGLIALANTALILEEGARFQLLAETLGGSKLFGPGVLEQQWKMSGLWQDSDAVAIAAE